jgi:hypothetical protein
VRLGIGGRSVGVVGDEIARRDGVEFIQSARWHLEGIPIAIVRFTSPIGKGVRARGRIVEVHDLRQSVA